eukprot:11947135-Heterocapsa_arctica.AAC.1
MPPTRWNRRPKASPRPKGRQSIGNLLSNSRTKCKPDLTSRERLRLLQLTLAGALGLAVQAIPPLAG